MRDNSRSLSTDGAGADYRDPERLPVQHESAHGRGTHGKDPIIDISLSSSLAAGDSFGLYSRDTGTGANNLSFVVGTATFSKDGELEKIEVSDGILVSIDKSGTLKVGYSAVPQLVKSGISMIPGGENVKFAEISAFAMFPLKETGVLGVGVSVRAFNVTYGGEAHFGWGRGAENLARDTIGEFEKRLLQSTRENTPFVP